MRNDQTDKSGDYIALAALEILEDPSYQKVFEKPKAAVASPVQQSFNALLKISEELDKLGFSESATKALLSAQGLLVEAGIEVGLKDSGSSSPSSSSAADSGEADDSDEKDCGASDDKPCCESCGKGKKCECSKS